MTENSGEYQLIFEGLEDQSADAVRKLKGVLIAEVQLSVEEVKEALDNPPRLLKVSHSEKVIKSLARKLRDASAKVTVVSPDQGTASEPEVLSGDLIEFDSISEDHPEAPTEEPPGDGGLEFAFDPDELAASAQKKQDIPTYELDLDETTDTSLLEFQDEEEPLAPPEQPLSETRESPEVSATFANPMDDKALDAQLDSLLDLTIADEPAATVDAQEEPQKSEDIDTSTLKLDDELISAKSDESPADTSVATTPTAPSGLSFDEDEKPASPPVPEPPAPKLEEKPKSGAIALQTEESSTDLEEVPKKPSEAKSAESPPAAPVEAPSGRLGDRLKSRKVAEEPAAPAAAAELDDTEESPPPITTSPRGGRSGFFGRHEIAIPIIVGALVLGAVNWFIFSSSEDEIDLELKQAIEAKLAKPPVRPQPAEEPKVEPTPIPRAYIKLIGSSDADGIKSKAEVMANDESILSGSVSIETPEPRELTPEEIVQNKVRPPWVTHIDIDAQQIKPDVNGAFQWEGPAKVYIEYQGERDRLLASASLAGQYHPKEARFELRYEIKRPVGIDARNRTFFIEANDKDGYQLALRGSLTGIETGRQVDGPSGSAAEANP